MTKLEQHMATIVTFMAAWTRHQDRWLASDPGSDAEAKATEAKKFYASMAHRRCVKLGLNPVAVLGVPACQDANEYDREIMKQVQAAQ